MHCFLEPLTVQTHPVFFFSFDSDNSVRNESSLKSPKQLLVVFWKMHKSKMQITEHLQESNLIF